MQDCKCLVTIETKPPEQYDVKIRLFTGPSFKAIKNVAKKIYPDSKYKLEFGHSWWFTL